MKANLIGIKQGRSKEKWSNKGRKQQGSGELEY